MIKVIFCGLELEVEADIEEPTSGTNDCPPYDGSIEINDIFFKGESVYDMVSEIINWEEKITDLIRKTL